MTVEAYYDKDEDGKAVVRPIGDLVLEKHQKVFITVPDDIEAVRGNRMKRQLAALEVLGGLLDDEEIKQFDEAMQRRPCAEEDKGDAMEALRGLQQFWGCLPSDFDADKELHMAREERYDRCFA